MTEKKQNYWSKFVSALAEIKNLELDSKAYNYKYTSLPKILDHVKPILAKYNLAVIQECTVDENSNPAVVTKIICSDGILIESQQISANTEGLKMNAVQASGAVYTYLRRYALTALLGIAGDADIDANIDTHNQVKKRTNKAVDNRAKPSQVNKIVAIAKSKYPDEIKEFIKSVASKNGLPDSSDKLTIDQADILIKCLEDAK